jgi:hypothetical protein
MILATYPSSHAALDAERSLKAAGFSVDLIPVPRQVHSRCGFCLLLDMAGDEAALGTTGPDQVWRALDPAPGTHRRRYEPYP